MPSPLKPLGFDIPQSMGVQPNVPQQLPQPDNTALQVLGQASQRFDQTLQLSTQTAQQTAQSTASMMQAATQTSQSIAETSMQEAKARANRSAANAQSFNNLGETVMRVAGQYAERQAKMQEQLQAAQEAAAVKDLEAARVDWIQNGRLDKEGTSAYQDALASTIGKYNLPPKVITDLTQRYFSPALDYAKQVESNRQEAIKDAAVQQRRVNSQRVMNKLSTSLAYLSADTPNADPAKTQEVMGNVMKDIDAVLSDETMSWGDRLYSVGTALETTREALLKRNISILEFNNVLEGFQAVRQLEAELAPQVRSGAMADSEYKGRITQEALQRGLKNYSPTDPQSDLKTTYEILNTTQGIQKIQQDSYLEGLNAIPVNDDTIAALATEYVLSPGAWGAARNLKPEELDRNGREAVKITGEWFDYSQKERPELAIQIQRLDTRARGLQSDFDRWYVEARRSAQQNQQVQSPSKILEQLRGFSPDLAQQLTGKPLSLADVEAVATAYGRERDGVVNEMNRVVEQLRNRDTYFLRYGLSTDVERVKAENAKRKQALREREAQMQKLQLEKLKMPQQPGSEPNFNGAALPRKALAKRKYGGQNITMPFEASVAATIYDLDHDTQGFGARRDGGARKHQGLDFGVPIGTRALSLVSGKVINVTGNIDGYGINMEVLGDDGNKYFYAHLSKVLAQKNQRVDAGSVIALTGNTHGRRGSSDPHLHLEVTDANGRIIDPLGHLASRDFARAPQPRSAGSSRPGDAQPVIPAGAIPMGRNTFLHNGKVIRLNYGLNTAPNVKTTPANYSTAAPIRNSYAGGKTGDKRPDANHGYAILANDRQFATQLNRLASKWNIEPEWLADLIAHETDNTFDPTIPNYEGSGHYGLIQFGPAVLQDLGLSLDQLKGMSRVQQLGVVDRYIKLQLGYAGLKDIRSPEELAAVVFMGGQGLADLRRTGKIGGELAEYLSKMGRFAGRQYDSSANRRRRASTVIHDRLTASCSVCANMLSDSFFPHEAQLFREYTA
ncbi:peptidase [Phormidium phage Pf-WMP4]|uniref:PfWMP4_33 n=1 Tax=Phormidium phage Pf-WMP4 TaxID=2913979 RepID=Q0GBT3_9CAUD|nr:peptidase [Phormidium phage Pf-WMP4]ABI33177.1 PfWMP4_33 [Phormidium phage Pf-WMP4]